MPHPLTQVEHQIEFVKCHDSIGSDHELMTQVSLGAAEIIIKILSTCEKMTAADKSTALMLVHNSAMMQQDKDAVIPRITAMPTESDPGARQSSLQTHDFIENYIPKWVWDVLNSDVSMHRKLHVMTSVFEGLGLWHPTEGTSGRAANLCLLHGSTHEERLGLGPGTLHHLKVFKKLLRNAVPSAKRAESPAPAEYPQDAEEFRQQYPSWYAHAYANGPPCLGQLTLEDKARIAPQRCRRAKGATDPAVETTFMREVCAKFGFGRGWSMLTAGAFQATSP